MKRFEPLIVFVFCVLCCVNFNNYLTSLRKNIELNNKKEEHINMVKDIDTYKKYEESYNLVFSEGKSLEDKLKDLEKDIDTKSERVSYYKKSIEELNNKLK